MPQEPTRPIDTVIDAFAGLLEKEKDLAVTELKPAVKSAGVGAGMYVAAGAFVLHAIWMFVIIVALLIGLLLDALTPLGLGWSLLLGFVVSMLLSLGLAALLFLGGTRWFKRVKAPEATIAEARATIEVVVDTVTGRDRQAGEVVPAGSHASIVDGSSG